MATRFYFSSQVASTWPNADPSWELTTGAQGKLLLRKSRLSSLDALADISPKTIPITTTQDIQARVYISEPIPPQNITGTVSLVIRVSESSIDANATLAVMIRVVTSNIDINRGTLFSVYGTDTEFPLTASAATRIVNAQAVTPLITQPGDRIVVDIGARVTAPATAQTFLIRDGFDAASDFALTSGLTTDLNPWIEFSQNIWSSDLNNYQFLKVGNGMSTGEKIR